MTLATEDGHKISAHKIILTSCSQVFRNLLSTLDHPHPMIYMMGVKSKQLELVLQYVYQGRCELGEADVDDFLATGRDLLVQGFFDGSLLKKETTNSAISDVSGNRKQDFQFFEESGLSEVFEETSLTEKKITDPPVVDVDKSDAERKSWSSDDHKEEEMEQEHLTHASDDSTVLGSIDSTVNLFVKEENTFGSELLTPKLKIEDTESRANHQQEPKKYFCDQCSYKSTQNTNLTKHKEKHHLKIRHNCEECDFSTLTKQYLKIHQDTKHSKVEYNCDVCGFNAKWPSQKAGSQRHCIQL